MIPQNFITEWRKTHPWPSDAQVEQDLILCRGLVELFNNSLIRTHMAFRGGTALHKLHFQTQARYSEDIDLVQKTAEPIGPVIDAIRATLDPWLGAPKREFGEGRVTITYRYQSGYPPPDKMRLKIEINSREHFSEFGFIDRPFDVASGWFRQSANLSTYVLDELLGTKLRALYQRKKGRDLFHLSHALEVGGAFAPRIVQAFSTYMKAEGRNVSRAEFEQNLHAKKTDKRFVGDISAVLAAPENWNIDGGFRRVLEEIVCLLPGDAWRGNDEKA